jgi:hypothetical protein
MSTTTKTRTDIHRVAVMDPADYRMAALYEVPLAANNSLGDFENYLGMDDESAQDYLTEHRAEGLKDLTDGGEPMVCDLCGHGHSNTYYAFQHRPTDEVIWTGRICAGKVGLDTREELDELRRGERRVMAIERGHFLFGHPDRQRAVNYLLRKVEEFMVKRELSADDVFGYRGEFFVSLLHDFQTKGRLSDAQLQALLAGPAKDAEREAKLAEERSLLEGRDDVIEWLRHRQENPVRVTSLSGRMDEILNSIAQRFDDKGSITPKQLEMVELAMGVSDAEDVTPGRQVITGEVLKVTEREDHFSPYGGIVYKMTVKDDRGFKVWGTVPSGLGVDIEGERVTFTGTVQPSDEDPKFGFFKRPAKADFAD